MGLDMYLYKCKKDDYLRRKDSQDALRWMLVEANFEKWSQEMGENFELPIKLKPVMTEEQCTEHNCKQVIDWRYANQIYGWLLANADADINGDVTVVTKEKILLLRDVCEQVLRDGFSPKGHIRKSVCRRLLPTKKGPFFGDYIYDEYYMEEVSFTLSELNQLIATTDFENDILLFTSSW